MRHVGKTETAIAVGIDLGATGEMGFAYLDPFCHHRVLD
jgi:hypothetical protein